MSGADRGAGCKVLIVEDDPVAATLWARVLCLRASGALIAHSVADARRVCGGETNITGAIVDYHLPDGTGDVIVQELCERQPRPGIAVVTGYGTAALALDMHALGVLVLSKPLTDADMSRLMDVVTAQGPEERTMRRFRLSPKQCAAVQASQRGLTLEQAADELGMKVSTLRSHWERIYDKTGAQSRTQREVIGMLAEPRGRYDN